MAGLGAKADPATTERLRGRLRERLRLDKWLWHARFFKGRDLAAEVVTSGHCRINGQRCRKPGHGVIVGDVLTFAQDDRIRVIRILALGVRRGPASAAQALFCDLDPAALPLASSARLD